VSWLNKQRIYVGTNLIRARRVVRIGANQTRPTKNIERSHLLCISLLSDAIASLAHVFQWHGGRTGIRCCVQTYHLAAHAHLWCVGHAPGGIGSVCFGSVWFWCGQLRVRLFWRISIIIAFLRITILVQNSVVGRIHDWKNREKNQNVWCDSHLSAQNEKKANPDVAFVRSDARYFAGACYCTIVLFC
jgi:hypothetical protein